MLFVVEATKTSALIAISIFFSSYYTPFSQSTSSLRFLLSKPITLSGYKLCFSSDWDFEEILSTGLRMARTGNKNVQAKLVLLGDMGAGKTSLVLRFVKGQFLEYQESTIGAAFFTQVLSLNQATIKFDIWDTAGQERYHSLAPMYYRGAAAAVVVYDITSMDSFVRAKKWVQELQRQGNPNLIMFLAANKADLAEKRKVGFEDGEQFAKEHGMVFLETSAKTAQNVNELFYEIAKKLAKASPSRPTGMKLHRGSQDGGRRLFCCSV